MHRGNIVTQSPNRFLSLINLIMKFPWLKKLGQLCKVVQLFSHNHKLKLIDFHRTLVVFVDFVRLFHSEGIETLIGWESDFCLIVPSANHSFKCKNRYAERHKRKLNLIFPRNWKVFSCQETKELSIPRAVKMKNLEKIFVLWGCSFDIACVLSLFTKDSEIYCGRMIHIFAPRRRNVKR